MKNVIKNSLATTGLTIITLAVIATFYQAKFLFISSVFESFAANILIHGGLIIVRKLESKYVIVETLLEVWYVLLVLIPFGFLFGWYSSTPLWMVILMGIVIYFAACFINIMKLNDDISFINKQLKILNSREEIKVE